MRGTLREAAVCQVRREPGREEELLPLNTKALRLGDTEDEGGLRSDGGLEHGILLE